jgi:hypothetical protein
MLLHAVSSSPKSLEEPALLMRSSPPSVADHAEESASSKAEPAVQQQTIRELDKDDEPKHDALEASGMTSSDTAQTSETPSLARVVSLELDAYTPPAAAPEDELAGLSLAQEVRTLLPPEFDISPSSSVGGDAPTTPRRHSDSVTTRSTRSPDATAPTGTGSLTANDVHLPYPTLATSPPTIAGDQSPLLPSTEVGTASRPDSGEFTVTANRDDKAPSQTTEASEAEVSDHKPKEEASLGREDKQKSKGGSIRKEKDKLMLLGDGLISPSSSGMLRAREPDEREAEELLLGPGEQEDSFFMLPRLPIERPSGIDLTPPRVTATDEHPSGVRKERRTSLLHNLFSVRYCDKQQHVAQTTSVRANCCSGINSCPLHVGPTPARRRFR